MPERLYLALGRLLRFAADQEPVDLLSAALEEAQGLVGAELAVLRAPNGVADVEEIRVPHGASWPQARLLDKWHAQVTSTGAPVPLRRTDLPRQSGFRHGMALPVFAASGSPGTLLVVSSRATMSAGHCAAASLCVQCALARIEAARLRQQTEAAVSSEVHDRLARDLHDGPLQMLTALLMRVRMTGKESDASSQAAVAGLEGELKQVVAQIRSLIRSLRVSHPQGSLEERIRHGLARLEEARGLSWTLRWHEPNGGVAAGVADEIFHVINEALANVYRHAMARHVSITGRVRADMFEVIVRDDGIGFDVAQALRRDIRSLSFGLVSMQERVGTLGGILTLRSQAGRGTRVMLSLPLERLNAEQTA